MTTKVLTEINSKEYDDFLLRSPNSLLFASSKYLNLIKTFLNEDVYYFISYNDTGEIAGVLPAILKKNEKFGSVLNSLPFYGSNAGIIEHNNNFEVRKALIDRFYLFATENNCVSTTLISSPFDTDLNEFYETNSKYTFKDSRIGQLSPLPHLSNQINEDVMKLIDSKMRNLIRKAQKLNISVHSDNNPEVFTFLKNTHHENMQAIGGTSKPDHFFNAIPTLFTYGSEYKIYYAKLNGEIISAVLLFYFNKTVEYYTPVIKAEHRSSQPLSLLIFEAMKEAVSSNFTWWNWGGTWASQGGVYHFKKQWGTQDKMYYYYTRILNENILKAGKETLLNEYPYFFVAPFNKI